MHFFLCALRVKSQSEKRYIHNNNEVNHWVGPSQISALTLNAAKYDFYLDRGLQSHISNPKIFVIIYTLKTICIPNMNNLCLNILDIDRFEYIDLDL